MTREEYLEFVAHNEKLVALLEDEFPLLLETAWWPTMKSQIIKLERILGDRVPKKKSMPDLLQRALSVLRECEPIVSETPAIENSLPDRIDCTCADIEERLLEGEE